MDSGFFEPLGDVFEGLFVGDVVDEQGSGGRSVVRPGDRLEGLLPRGVPDLQFDVRGLDVDHFGSEFDADGVFEVWVEGVVDEPQEDAGLADSRVADDDVFE